LTQDNRAWWPPRASIDMRERLRSCMGAMLGILATGWVGAWAVGAGVGSLWLMAPMGASAVLLFAVPASPLAQPWSIVGGNLVAAVIGVTCAKFFALPLLAACVALPLTVAAMFALRCVHPPSGAVALLGAVGGPQVHSLGYLFVLTPVMLNTACLLGMALAYNRLVGRRYPHRVQAADPRPARDADNIHRMGFTPADLRAALAESNQLLDVSEDDLEALFRKTEMQAYSRRFGNTLCRQLMLAEPPAVEYGTELAEAWRLLGQHTVDALPVVDRGRRVVGIVTRSDFLRHAGLDDARSISQRLRSFLRRTPHSHSSKHEVVGQIMTAPVRTAHESLPIVELVPLMTEQGFRELPVVNDNRRLVGMVTQSDLVAALYETSLGRMGGRA